MQAGAVAVLDKPFSDEQLLKNIRTALTFEEDSRTQRERKPGM
jgi:FixJ family two-component response regulator